MSVVQLERMTWPEVAAALEVGKRTVIVPVGASEQHGPHLPEATDTLLAEALAVRIAERLGDALVAPSVRPGFSEHHMGFPGTITFSEDLLLSVLDAYVASLTRHGFKRIVVFSTHGGNYPALGKWRPASTGVIVLHDLNGFLEAMLGGIRKFGRTDTTTPHADVSETSEMLALHPDLVRTQLIERGFVGEVSLAELLEKGLRAISPIGVLGDPVGSSPEIGVGVIESLVTYFVTQCQQHVEA
jgi:creatinine amidohydrolase